MNIEEVKDEVVEKILGLDVKVKTNKCDEKIIRLMDFVNAEDSTIAFNYFDYMKPKRQIIITINCDGYSFEVVDTERPTICSVLYGN